jgi:hypothetical protein
MNLRSYYQRSLKLTLGMNLSNLNNINLQSTISPQLNVDLKSSNKNNPVYTHTGDSYIIDVKLMGEDATGDYAVGITSSPNISTSLDTIFEFVGADFRGAFHITPTVSGDHWISISVKGSNESGVISTRKVYHLTSFIPIALDIDINPSHVVIDNGGALPSEPTITITYSNVDSISIIGGPNTTFNGGMPILLDVNNSANEVTLERVLPFSFFENQLGTKTLTVHASTGTRSVVKSTAVEFTTQDIVDADTIFTNINVSRQAMYRGERVVISYIPQNSDQLLVDSGGFPRFMDVSVGLIASDGTEIILNTVPYGETHIQVTISDTLPIGTYQIFVQGESRYGEDGGDTRSIANSVLTIQPGSPPPIPTLDSVVDGLFDVICGEVDIPVNINKIINRKKVLTNLLVSPSFENDQLIFTHVSDTDGSVVVKLYEPTNSTILDEFFIVHEVVDPSLVEFSFDRNVIVRTNELRGPNFSIDDVSDLGLPISDITIVGTGRSRGTPLLRYDELLRYKGGSEHTTITDDDLSGYGYVVSGSMTTDILNSVLSGSAHITDDHLAIDHSDYSNFVFYSSAKERLINFKYKLQVIESDQTTIDQIRTGGAVTSSAVVNHELGALSANINRIRSTFDGYEKYLYYGSGTSSWPKSASVIVHSTGSTSISFFTSQSNVASEYDNDNYNSLTNLLPEHIVRDSANVDFLLFTSMLGQHFDVIKSHIDSMRNIYVRTHTSGSGTPTNLLKPVLESFGWSTRTSGETSELTDYIIGKRLDGTSLSSSAKKREETILRRFLNNLPYLLKTKGTRASIRAIFNIYGIPDSFVQIREFGGPSLMTGKNTYYTFDDPIAELNLSGSEQVEVDWLNTALTRKPDSIELSFRTDTPPTTTLPAISGSWNLIRGAAGASTYFNVFVDSEPSSSFNGRVRFAISGSSGIQQISSSKLPLFDGNSFTMMVTRTSGSFTDDFNLYVKKSLYTKITHESSASVSVSSSLWDSATDIVIGNEYSGSVDEFRMWRVPLSEDSFNHHVRWHESIRGDNYTSSIQDLVVRLTFDRPQELSTTPLITNFAYTASNGYGVSHATASNFSLVSTAPYQFSHIEQDSSFEAPTIGFKYETDKIRFESHSFLDGMQLDRGRRITKKAFDQSPIDSNKLGIFFSPASEINRDIVRAFTGHDFMNEIGDPDSVYSSSYSDLDTINQHYWERNSSSMNIYDYITLVRQFDKTVFDYVQDVTPVRVKLSKGILIEPHMLERNRLPLRKPSRDEQSYEGAVVVYDTGSLAVGEVNQLSASLAITESLTPLGTFDSLDGTVDVENEMKYSGSLNSYNGMIGSLLSGSTDDDFNASSRMDNIGFGETLQIPRHTGPNFASASYNYSSFGMSQNIEGVYAIDGISDIIYIKDGVEGRKRVKLELININEYKTVSQLVNGGVDGQEGAYHNVIITESIQYLNVLHISASFTGGSSKLDGYISSHRSKNNSISTGLRNSFYGGSVQTSETTIDGSSPIEVFISDVKTLKVNKTGGSNDEPILTVE